MFVAKSPPHVLHVAQLARHFRNTPFLFMVRSPYAVCEGICRHYRTKLGADYQHRFVAPGRSLPATAPPTWPTVSFDNAATSKSGGAMACSSPTSRCTGRRLLPLRTSARQAADAGVIPDR